jgi:hypothetical protein
MAPGGLECVTGIEAQKVAEREIASEFGLLVRGVTALHQRRITNQHKEAERALLANRGSIRGALEKFGLISSELNRHDARLGRVAKEQAIAIKLLTYRMITAALTRHIPIVHRAAAADKPAKAINVLRLHRQDASEFLVYA